MVARPRFGQGQSRKPYEFFWDGGTWWLKATLQPMYYTNCNDIVGKGRAWVDERTKVSQSKAAIKIFPHRLVSEVDSGNSLTAAPGFHAMFEGTTSDEDKIPWEVPEAELQIMNVKTSTLGEASSNMKWRPLSWWIL